MHVVGEETWRVDHCLAAVADVPVASLTRVLSHPQGLEQCARFLRTLPGAVPVTVFDTAEAMRVVAEQGDPTWAGIGSPEAAEAHGLVVLRRGLADRAENWTRFLLLARTPVAVPDRVPSKTSLVLVTRHEEGALLRCLEALSRTGHSLTKLESRPRPGSPFEYLFFLDFEGNVAEPRTQEVLDELREATARAQGARQLPRQGRARRRAGRGRRARGRARRGRPRSAARRWRGCDHTPPEGRKLLRLEVRNAETPIEKKPSWIKTRAVMGPEYTELKSLVKREGLHTVCEEAGCPNIYECWEDREATFLIGGDQCTRRCDFCNIDTGKPAAYDTDEPRRVAESVATMGLRYATITGVARDDLPDGGAWLYAETVRLVHEALPGIGVELLIPDFDAKPEQLAEVFARGPRCSRTTSRRSRGSSAGSGPASATSARST